METNIITKVNELLVKEDAINKATARNFNIYKILGIESKETYICRAIAALLDDNYHNQGNCFLELFFKYVLGREYKGNKYKIITEETIENYRRIDIVIKSNNEYIPIEAKIYAGDQQSQCYDYYIWASKTEKDKAKVYYLTLDGHLPSKESVKDLEAINGKEDENNKNDNIIGYKGIECISFRKHILDWLSECLKCDCAIRIDNIRNMILQLDENIRELTGTNVNLNKKIQSYFNCNNIDKVFTINTETILLKFKIRKKIFEIIMNYYGIEETKKNGDIDIRKVYEDYPYIRFKIGNENDNINIWFSIEINEETGRLWVGINCSKDKSWFDAIKEGYYKKFIKKEINSDEWFTRDWWLLNKTVEGSPDFRNLVKVKEWWNENKQDHIRNLLNEIDRIKNVLKKYIKKEYLLNPNVFPNDGDLNRLDNNSLMSFGEKEFNNIESKIKIYEAFKDYEFKVPQELINLISEKIKKETNLKRTDVSDKFQKRLDDSLLYFKLSNINEHHILYAVEFKYNYIGLIVADNNFNQKDNSSDIKKEIWNLFEREKISLEETKIKYEKESDKRDWWLYCNANTLLSCSDKNIKDYLKHNKVENIEYIDFNTIEKIINDIKYFKEKLDGKY